jgi:DNA repair protein RadC
MHSEFTYFDDYEIVELLLALINPRQDVKPLATMLLKTFGSIKGIFDASADELLRLKELGKSTAVALKVIRAINSLYLQKRFEGESTFDSFDKAFELWKNRLLNLEIDVLEIAYLNSNLQLMKMELNG